MADNQDKPMKMYLASKNASNKIASSKGHEVIKNSSSYNQNWFSKNSSNIVSDKRYPDGGVVSMSLTKNAQWTGGLGANVIFTQPMFFSPLHTPQNWQIASKRREVYQWARFYYENEPKVAAGIDFYCFTPDSMVMMPDGSQKPISKIKEGNLVVSSDGSVNRVVKVFSRYTNEEMLKIKVSGLNGLDIKVTKGHEILTYKDGEYKYVQSQELTEGDVVLTPCLYGEKTEISSYDKDFAWLLGVYAAEGCGIPYSRITKRGRKVEWNKGIYFYCNINEKETLVKDICEKIYKIYGVLASVRLLEDSSTCLVSVYGKHIAKDFCGLCGGTSSEGDKSFSPFIMNKSSEFLLHILGGFMSGDGCFNKNNGLQGVGVSRKLCEQISYICDRIGIEHSFTINTNLPGKRQDLYNVRISRKKCVLLEDICYKINSKSYIGDDFFARNTPYYIKDNYIHRKIVSIEKINYEGDVFDLEIENKHSYIVNKICVHNSQFPLTSFNLVCKSTKVLRYFERLIDKLEISTWFKKISHEYFLLGDVFIWTDIDCPHCHGTQKDDNGELCNHPDGTISKIRILNPDWIDVDRNQIGGEPLYKMIPDDELYKIVTTRKPEHIYNQLSPMIKQFVAARQPFPLSNRSCSHLKHRGVAYGVYGESIIRRLFTVLAYKTKLMTANWITAERLILPIRIVKVGDKDRPAGPEDIADVQNQLSQVANDPNLTLVTHHAFEYDWVGATGRIHNITAELELIGKEILDGLMLNQALLNGEMSNYASAQVGIETMIQRLQVWRNELAQWAEKHIFLPVAQMQGFIDEKESKEAGETVYIYPKIKWDDLRLRDNTNQLQAVMQLHDKGVVSTQTLLEKFDLDYDQEIRRIREEQIQTMPSGQVMGMGGSSLGGLGGGGGGMGGPPGPMGTPPVPGGDIGGGSIGGMGGTQPGQDASSTPMGSPVGGSGGGIGGQPPSPTTASSVPDKIYKPGDQPKKKEEEVKPIQPQSIFFTKPEMKIYNMLQTLDVPFVLYAQFKQQVPGQQQPYVMDFAYPHLGIDIESDGEFWHTREEDVERDRNRDYKLASVGWRVLRFTEAAINERMDEIKQVVFQQIQEAANEKKSMQKKANNDSECMYKVSQTFDGEVSRCISVSKPDGSIS